MLWSLLKPLWKSPEKLILEILSICFYSWEGWWKVKCFQTFYSHLVEVWHSLFKMTVGSYAHKASPVFLKWYNFWQNFSGEVGNTVQPNCYKILGAGSCASAWDAVSLCREMWKGCRGVLQGGPNSAPVGDCLAQGSQLLLHVPRVPREIRVVYSPFTFPGVCASSWQGLSLSDKLLSCSAQPSSFPAHPLRYL